MRWLLAAGLAALVVAWLITRPTEMDASLYDGLEPDKTNGALVFSAAGCASCHVAPDSPIGEAPVLSGGQSFASDFGTFYAPNISPDATNGIGGWSLLAFANAVQSGVSPNGQHYYPAFPYTAYMRMTPQDLVDLKAYMDELPPSDALNQRHEVGFPFNIRRSLGGWKLLFAKPDWVVEPVDTIEMERGRYLVEALGHCAECHTPRNALGGLQRAAWLSGGVLPGEGTVPGITPDQLDWIEDDIVYYLETGFTPDFDNAGGAMAHVVENMSKLPQSDREAIALYLISLR